MTSKGLHGRGILVFKATNFQI